MKTTSFFWRKLIRVVGMQKLCYFSWFTIIFNLLFGQYCRFEICMYIHTNYSTGGIILLILYNQARNLHSIQYKLLLQFSQKINGQNELCFPQRKVVGMSGQLPLNLTYLLLPKGWFHLYLCHFPFVYWRKIIVASFLSDIYDPKITVIVWPLFATFASFVLPTSYQFESFAFGNKTLYHALGATTAFCI